MQDIRSEILASERATALATARFDHGFEQAKASLSVIARDDIYISVAGISLQPRGSSYQHLLESNSVSVMQEFHGEYPGVLLLLMEPHHCTQIINSCVRDGIGSDIVSEVDNDTVCELGNIILNCTLRTISILTGNRLHCSQPRRPTLECIKKGFSESGVYQSDIFAIDINYCGGGNDIAFSVPLSMKLHLGDNAHLKRWENMAYQSIETRQL
ncbi:MAG: hypothetical protein JKY01_13395 [Pseudomonadales bacterium]|nr:hypothetical protein [Pseudomonadales bacterium]